MTTYRVLFVFDKDTLEEKEFYNWSDACSDAYWTPATLSKHWSEHIVPKWDGVTEQTVLNIAVEVEVAESLASLGGTT